MGVDLNSASTAQGRHGPLKGEDRTVGNSSNDGAHEDQLGIRHTESGGDELTVVIGNSVQGVNNGIGDAQYEEDVRPAQVWIVPDPWGDSADTNNAAWPDWWTAPGVTGGMNLIADWNNGRPQDYFNNVLSIDRISNMTSIASLDTGIELANSYPLFIGNRVYVPTGTNASEVGCVEAVCMVEDVGNDTGENEYGTLTDILSIGGYIGVRCPIDRDGQSLNKTSVRPMDTPYWSNLIALTSGNGTTNPQPKLRTYAGYFSVAVMSAFYNDGTDDRSRIRFGVGFFSHLVDGTGYAVQEPLGETLNGYSTGFQAAVPWSVNAETTFHGSERVYGLKVDDLCKRVETFKLTGAGHYQPVRTEFIGVKIDDQNGDNHSPNCDLYGLQVGDLTNKGASTNSKIRAVETNGGDIHFNGPGTSQSNGTVNVHFGDANNTGRLTIGKTNTQAKDYLSGGRPHMYDGGDLDVDTSGDQFGLGGVFVPSTPSGLDGTSTNYAKRVASLAGALLLSNTPTIKGGSPADN